MGQLATIRRSKRKTNRQAELHPPKDPVQAARAAGLRYVRDDRPGLRRVRRGKGFAYVDPAGKTVRDAATLARIRSLAIPPAWTDVWVCPHENGHLQATGRDAKGRKQHRYHPRWREVRDETKYDRMPAFGEALPRIRAQVEHDLSLPGLPREKVLAAVVRLLELTFIRVGNEEYARTNRSFGLTTMRDRHVAIDGARLSFRFRGKSGKQHSVQVADRRLARIVKRCRDIPGQELFQYLDDDGERRSVTSGDVNDYLRGITGQDFTAKDFRTWAGTVLCACALRELGPCETVTQTKHNIVEAIKSVAERLGNTPAICRKSYVHPTVLDVYQDESLRELLSHIVVEDDEASSQGLRPEEAMLMALLRERVARQQT